MKHPKKRVINSKAKAKKEIQIRMKELVIQYPNDYFHIVELLKNEFPELEHTSNRTLCDRARYHGRQTQKRFTPMSHEIGKNKYNKPKTVVLTVSKKYLLERNLWQNTICLSGMNNIGGYLQYSGEVRMGANVTFADMDLSSINLGCVLIVADVKDCMDGDIFPPHIVHKSLSEDLDTDEFVLVMMAGSHSIRDDKGQKCWDDMFIHDIQKLMKQTVIGDGSKHHQSVGKYHGFGWIAKYDKRGDCSYGRVALKKGKSLSDYQMLYDQFAIDIDCMTMTLNQIIPGVVEKGQCIANELIKMSRSTATETYERIKPFHEGMILGMVCHNAQTGQAHVEKDCSFTLIGIPFGENDINAKGMFVFEFGWGRGKFIRIKLLPGTVIYYSAHDIMHRQYSLSDQLQLFQNYNFWNVAIYTTHAFYEKAMTSFSRKKAPQKNKASMAQTQNHKNN